MTSSEESTSCASDDASASANVIAGSLMSRTRRATNRMMTEVQRHLLAMEAMSFSWVVGAISIWHTALFWAIAVTVACIASCYILHFHRMWYSELLLKDQKSLDPIYVIAVFIKSYVVTWVAADLCMFCYSCCVDAWRADTFEGLRRLVCLQAWPDLLQGYLRDSAWPRHLRKRTRCIDLFVQAILFGSLDVVPAVFLFGWFWGSTHSALELWASVSLTLAGCVLCLFVFAWTLGQYVVKISTFLEAWNEATSAYESESPKDPESLDESTIQLTSLCEVRCDRNSPLPSLEEHLLGWPPAVAGGPEEHSICVVLCTCFHWCEYFCPILVAFGCLAAGAVLKSPVMWSTGLIAFVILFSVSLVNCKMRLDGDQVTLKLNCWKHIRQPSVLHRWGTQYCGLSIESKSNKRQPFWVMAMLSGSILAYFGFTRAAFYLYVMSGVVLCQQVFMRCERPWGWLIGLTEALMISGAIELLAMYREPNRALHALMFALCSVLLEFGLDRQTVPWRRVRFGSGVFLSLVHIVVLAVTCMCVITEDSSGSTYRMPDHFITIPPVPPAFTSAPYCEMSFFPGSDSRRLTLLDFALMSSLAYESNTSEIEFGLQLYLPGWRLEKAWLSSDVTELWSSLMMFTSADNKTSVFAVRGTQTAIDALTDISIYLAVSILQVSQLIGPSIIPVWGAAIMRIVRFFSLDKGSTNFNSLMKYINRVLEQHSERKFFITGHSLGGGLAKLLANQQAKEKLGDDAGYTAKVHWLQRQPLQAVSFSSPGTRIIKHFIFDIDSDDNFVDFDLADVTLMPENDLVSQIGSHAGTVVRIHCSGSALNCHFIWPTICTLVESCGSNNPSGNLSIPCGRCLGMPC
eukprot:TRINITY_DN51270_c0_g1_i1.p1 TRINITY_DN51270_c0_g1~~TRINITY_DN51270_c0_g1_i1.p1  ORF type:complete len:858 (+),score=71.41 TRINITY_DN51270_c0_g1_i1:30-2603(+)